MLQLKIKKKLIAGFAMTSELIFLSTIVTGGLTVGMVTTRDSVVSEINDVAEAIGSLDQSFALDGIINSAGTIEVAGSSFGDGIDVAAGDTGTWTFVAPAVTERNVNVVRTDDGAIPPVSEIDVGGASSGADGNQD